jgi:hypothetical protein
MMEPPSNLQMHIFLSEFECELFLVCTRNLTMHGATQNRGDAAGDIFSSLSTSFHLRPCYVMVVCGILREIQL